MIKRIQKHGNSHALVIDKILLAELGWDYQTELKVTTDGESLFFKPLKDQGKWRSMKTFNCPYCKLHFKNFVSNVALEELSQHELIPGICEGCAGLWAFYKGVVISLTKEEQDVVRQSPAWDAILEPAEKLILENLAKQKLPVDRTARVLTDGSPITEDYRELKENGQQKDYVVLSENERQNGWVRPFRDAYRHLTCGTITTMNRAIAETYARDPGFYNATFCLKCKTHLPIGANGEFTWYEMDGSEGPMVGT